MPSSTVYDRLQTSSFIRFIVRSKKDKDALNHLLSSFWTNSEILTVKEKSYDGVLKLIEKFKDKPLFLLFAELDKKQLNFEKIKNYIEEKNLMHVYVIEISKKKFRNERLSNIFSKIQDAFLKFSNRFDVSKMKFAPFSKTYEDLFIFSKYLVTKEKNILKFYNFTISEKTLSEKTLEFQINLESEDDIKNFEHLINTKNCFDKMTCFNKRNNDTKLEKTIEIFDELFDKNDYYFNFMIEHSKFMIKEAINIVKPDMLIVPFSGGKDSTALLLLVYEAIKEFKIKLPVFAIYVETTYDFPILKRYVEYIRKKLSDVKIIFTYANFRDLSYEDFKKRMCTKIKINALYDEIKKLEGKKLILVGNRATESFNRRKRGLTWIENNFDEIWYFLSPIFFWNYIMIQYYVIYLNRLKLNPLYSCGLYRTGCWNCPFISRFEKTIISKFELNKL